jgi:predicted nucleic acid-binding protein
VVIVDTTVWIDFLTGHDTAEAHWLDRELTRQRLGLTDLILCEILQGIPIETEAARTLRALVEIPSTSRLCASISLSRRVHYTARTMPPNCSVWCD